MKQPLIRTLCAGFFGTLVPLGTPVAMAQEIPTASITTDTLEYCVNLQHMVLQRGSRLAEVQHLLSEGRRMCDHGEIRVGIARLRQALIMMRRPIEPEPGVESEEPR